MTKSKKVQMRFDQSTINKINELAKLTKTTNRTQIVKGAISLSFAINNIINSGGKLYVEYQDKETKQQLIFI